MKVTFYVLELYAVFSTCLNTSGTKYDTLLQLQRHNYSVLACDGLCKIEQTDKSVHYKNNYMKWSCIEVGEN